MKIVAAVVTYNRKALLHECIDALLAQDYSPFDILIIDNASTDGTQESLTEYIAKGQISYVNTGANLGGAGGFQCAIRESVEQGYDAIWMMDDDTIPRSDALGEMVAAANAVPPGWGFLSGKALWTDGSFCKMNEQKLLRGDLYRVYGIAPCREATFVSLFLSAETVREIGLPIKEFFIWGDDVEYTRRISARRPSYYVSQSVVTHKTANNVGSNIAKDVPERLPRYRYAYRNEVYIARHEDWKRRGYQSCKIIYHLIRVMLTAKSDRWQRMKTIVCASAEGLSFNPQIEFAEHAEQTTSRSTGND